MGFWILVRHLIGGPLRNPHKHPPPPPHAGYNVPESNLSVGNFFVYKSVFHFSKKLESKTHLLNNYIIRLVRMHVLEMAEGPWCVLWQRSRAECPRLVKIFAWKVDFWGPWCVLWQHSRAECPRLVTIFAGVVVLLGPLMCPLVAQPGRMPQVGYDFWMGGSF